ncbi:uncharacterized protein LOC127282264 [Leptopilina boulardi]|uniref:uncharacterized protein LOC127282264 n=1 Tax=Leptopilina boulardi TaxID=63433 RepID=UPI0021F61006|nr:uncharacterized protein LOC127282264 [Leptopilina boulardi]
MSDNDSETVFEDYVDLFDLEHFDISDNSAVLDNTDLVLTSDNYSDQGSEVPANQSFSLFSLFEPSPIVASVSQHRLLALRVADLEERLGIFQFAIWKIPFENAATIISNLCTSIIGIECSAQDFTVIRKLDVKRSGVLVRVPSLMMKELIFTFRHMFMLRGYNVDIL